MRILFQLSPSICIEGCPFITRFKTSIGCSPNGELTLSIEGIPLITRFKTRYNYDQIFLANRIEGIPLITRFKTLIPKTYESKSL